MQRVSILALILVLMTPADYANTKEPDASSPPKADTRYLQLIDSLRWSTFSDRQQQLYVKAFLETFSFFMYGMSARDQQSAQDFSDMTACAEREPAKNWTIMTNWLFGDLKATAASQCFKISGYICQKYRTKGDSKWTPVQLVSADEWSKLTPEDKEIYATAYVETEDVLSRTAKQDEPVERLESCMTGGGEKRFIDAAKTISIESEYPLPWSISRALGKACKQNESAVEPRSLLAAIGQAWDFFVDAWATVAFALLVLTGVSLLVAVIGKWLRDPSYRAGLKKGRAAKRAEFRSKPFLSRLFLRVAHVWAALVGILNLAVVAELFRESGAIHGFERWQEMYSPYTVSTYLINMVLLSPAFLLFWFADKVGGRKQSAVPASRDEAL